MAKGVAFSLEDMKTLWKSKSIGKSHGKNDRIEKNRGGISYYLFGNEIAHYNPEKKTLKLDDCGFQTATTKDRLNGLGAGITQVAGIWYTDSSKKTHWPGSATRWVK